MLNGYIVNAKQHTKGKTHQRLKKEGKLVNFAPGPAAALKPEQQGTAVEQEQQGPDTSSTATPTKRKIAPFAQQQQQADMQQIWRN